MVDMFVEKSDKPIQGPRRAGAGQEIAAAHPDAVNRGCLQPTQQPRVTITTR